MSKVVNTRRRFTRAVGFSVDRMMDGAFGAFEPREIKTVRLRLDEISARLVAERIIHPSQKLKMLPDGGGELTLRVGVAPDLIRWILGLGAHAEVLSPPELRKQVRIAAATIAGHHAK
jgi:proteasome accessory factor B